MEESRYLVWYLYKHKTQTFMLWISVAAGCVQLLALVVSCMLCRNIVNFEIEPFSYTNFGPNSCQSWKGQISKLRC